MSSSLTSEEEARYTEVIDGILAAADLQTVTRKKIRQGLEATIGHDLSHQKDAIKSLIEVRFDAISNPPDHQTNGQSPSDDAEADTAADGEIEVSLQPAKKKQKRESSSEDADARLAAELQAQENRLTRPLTRGGGANKASNKGSGKAAKGKLKKTPKKKSEKRARSEDGSDPEDDDEVNGKPKRKAGGGFQKPFNLSYSLQELTGEAQLSRPQVVKKLWEHIKAHDLQDPSDKRQIRCDEKMQAVFKQAQVNMFQMNKLLGSHLYPIDE